jgi:hypothetical protein
MLPPGKILANLQTQGRAKGSFKFILAALCDYGDPLREASTFF